MNVAIIPARGGSEGIPKKNLVDIGGTPLVVRAIETAKNVVSRVVVSTDDGEISRVAADAGAEVVHRPSELATNSATSEAAIEHALRSLPDVATVIFMQCTCPFTRPQDIKAALGLYENLAVTEPRVSHSVFAATPIYSGIWTLSGQCVNYNREVARPGRQQIRAPYLRETGAFYIFDPIAFLKTPTRFCGKTTPYIVPEGLSVEVDEPVDLVAANAIAKDFFCGQ